MDSKKSNKIRDVVRLHQILKKWKKLATTPKNPTTTTTTTTTTLNGGSSSNKPSINKFLKKTLSFSETTSATSNDAVRKGYVAVCVGKELKRFTIPMEYLSHQAFGMLLREAEEEFGFEQEGVLKIPCEVCVFEKILKVVEEKRDIFFIQDEITGCGSPSDCELTSSQQYSPMCR